MKEPGLDFFKTCRCAHLFQNDVHLKSIDQCNYRGMEFVSNVDVKLSPEFHLDIRL